MHETQRAMLWADPKLSKFDPLPRILLYDDFDRGMNGWTTLIGNYEGSIDRMLPGFQQIVPPMLSNLTGWDCGTHGSYEGTYALKLATRPRKGALTVAIKRLTYRKACPIRLEFYFTFKPEASELKLSELDVRSVGLLLDLQNAQERIMPHIRYLNALDGAAQQKWQFKGGGTQFHKFSDQTVSHFHLAPEGWTDIPGAAQRLCYNEIPSKVNWHYARLDFDLAAMRFVAFACNDHAFDLSRVEPMRMPAMKNLWCMLNLAFFAETDSDKRAMYFIDSVLVSGDF
jgi:hypothetical protein